MGFFTTSAHRLSTADSQFLTVGQRCLLPQLCAAEAYINIISKTSGGKVSMLNANG